jgi:hypothetical protein
MTDLTSTLSQLTEKHSEFGKDLATVLINFEKAHDSLKRIKERRFGQV